MKKNSCYWIIDGENYHFDTLREAKYHVYIAYTPRERCKYLRGTQICHYVDGELVSTVDINIDDNGRYSFGRVVKW